MEKDSDWYLITIYDQDCIPGKSVFKLINLINQLLRIEFVYLADLEGAGVFDLINEDQIRVMPIDLFLEKVSNVRQFDWGDFFLFKSFPDNWQTFEAKFYPDIISFTETTIRAIDDSYLYIYTPYADLVNLIKSHYFFEEIKKEKLTNLDYPY